MFLISAACFSQTQYNSKLNERIFINPLAGKGESINQIKFYSSLNGKIEGLPMMSKFVYDSSSKKRIGLRITNLPIFQIISMAHEDLMRENRPKIIIESSRKNEIMDWKNQANLYCYEIKVLPEKHESLYACARWDILEYFGLATSIEKRKIKSIVIVKTNNEIERFVSNDTSTRGSMSTKKGEGTIIRNGGIRTIAYFMQQSNSKLNMPVLDGTNFGKRINITIKSNFKDISSLKKELEQYGLSFIIEEREMDAIVVKDAGKDN